MIFKSTSHREKIVSFASCNILKIEAVQHKTSINKVVMPSKVQPRGMASDVP